MLDDFMLHRMGDGEDPEKRAMRRDAGHVRARAIDHQIRQAINFCWMAWGYHRQNLTSLSLQIRRLVDALKDFREDGNVFWA